MCVATLCTRRVSPPLLLVDARVCGAVAFLLAWGVRGLLGEPCWVTLERRPRAGVGSGVGRTPLRYGLATFNCDKAFCAAEAGLSLA